ncbi:MAG: hypothetical protein TREMPRED_005514 [Tremellales sp. Tagirdzhanova-0007]|nr:MAG: hypothetical protein TREMPRED_005514 [Tremellales sp. Tagirdzhanova-0007]
MSFHSSSRRPTFNASTTHPANRLNQVSGVQHRPHVSLAPSSSSVKSNETSKSSVPQEGVVSGGGGGGGVGAGSNEGMGRERLDIEDVDDPTAKNKSEGEKGAETGKGERRGGEVKKVGGDAEYSDVSKYHPAWEGFGKGPAEKGSERSKL